MKVNKNQVRSFTIDEAKAESLFISMSLSSEAPYLRSFGNEILLHGMDNVDMSRAGKLNGLPLLVSHNADILPIGRLKNIHLDLDTKKLRGDAYFSGKPEAQQIRQDILDGILGDVSIGYKILDYKVEKATRKDEPNTVYVSRWMPFEGSIVAVPADDTVGVGRSDSEEDTFELDLERAIEAGQGIEALVEEAEEATEDPKEEATETPAVEAAEDVAELVEEATEAIIPATVEDVIAEIQQEVEEVKVETVEVVEDDEDTTILNDANNTKSDLLNTERNSLKNLALNLKIQSETEIDEILNTRSIDEARTLLLKPRSTSIIISNKENRKMLNQETFYRGLMNAINGDFSNMEPEVAEMIKQKDNRSFYANLFTRANEMTTAAKGTNAIYEQNLGFLDILRARTAVLQAGAKTRVGNGSLSYVRQKTSVAATLRGENAGTTTNTYADFEKVNYIPKALTAKVYLTDELQKESVLDLQAILRGDMVKQFALAVDNYAINGNASPAITGLLSAGSGIYSDASTVALPAFAKVNNLKALVDAKAVDLSACAYLVTPGLLGVLECTPKLTNGSAIAENNKVNGYAVYSSSNVPVATVNHSAIFGDFSQLEICLQGATEFMVDTQSRFDEGITILTARQYFDIGIVENSAFAKAQFLIA